MSSIELNPCYGTHSNLLPPLMTFIFFFRYFTLISIRSMPYYLEKFVCYRKTPCPFNILRLSEFIFRGYNFPCMEEINWNNCSNKVSIYNSSKMDPWNFGKSMLMFFCSSNYKVCNDMCFRISSGVGIINKNSKIFSFHNFQTQFVFIF